MPVRNLSYEITDDDILVMRIDLKARGWLSQGVRRNTTLATSGGNMTLLDPNTREFREEMVNLSVWRPGTGGGREQTWDVERDKMIEDSLRHEVTRGWPRKRKAASKAAPAKTAAEPEK